MKRFTNLLRKLAQPRDESGQTLAEYSLILTLIALATVGALTAFAVSMDGLYEEVKYAAEVMLGV
jgi:Flp pilus assembly pilin Flp